jgi:antitoxin component YwqK of YwqJK toxin-antitoxin module
MGIGNIFKISASIILIHFLISANSAFGQINQVDSKGRKQGEWVKTFPKSKAIEYKGQFKNDKPVATFTYYFPSKKVKAVIKHTDSAQISIAYFYHENGNLMTYGRYKNYQKDSTWYNFGPSGRISFKENFHEDSLHGTKTVYFVPEDPNSKVERVSRIMNYKMGTLDGHFVEYFDYGNVRTQGEYLDNKRHGMWEDFQVSGKPMMKTRYRNGMKHGWCMAYDKTGKEINKSYYYFGQEKTGKDLDFIMKQMKEKGINPNGE